MPRFQCPGCNNEFTVVEEDIGQTVGCPHCGEPLDTGGDEAAAPAGPTAPQQPGYAPPWQAVAPGQPAAGPTYGYPPNIPGLMPAPTHRPRTAIASLMLGLFYWGGSILVGVMAAQTVLQGRNARNFEEAIRMSQELAENPPAWLTASKLILAACAFIGLFCAIHALTRRNVKKGMAIAGVILCGLASCCGLINVIGALMSMG